MNRWTRSLVVLGVALAMTRPARGDDGRPVDEPTSGQRVRLRLDDASARRRGERQLTGRLLEASAERYVLASEGDDERIVVPRESVERLDVSLGRSRRGRSALKGAGIGLGVGLVVFGTMAATCKGEGFECLGAAGLFVLGTPTATVLGAGIGAVSGEERWHAMEPSRRPRLSIAPTVGKGVGAKLALSF